MTEREQLVAAIEAAKEALRLYDLSAKVNRFTDMDFAVWRMKALLREHAAKACSYESPGAPVYECSFAVSGTLYRGRLMVTYGYLEEAESEYGYSGYYVDDAEFTVELL